MALSDVALRLEGPDFPQSPTPSHASLEPALLGLERQGQHREQAEETSDESELSFHIDGYASSVSSIDDDGSARSSHNWSRASSPCPSSDDLSHSRLHSVPCSPTPSLVVIHPEPRHHRHHHRHHPNHDDQDDRLHHHYQLSISRSPSPSSYSPPDTARPPARARLGRAAWPSHRIHQLALDLDSLEIDPNDPVYQRRQGDRSVIDPAARPGPQEILSSFVSLSTPRAQAPHSPRARPSGSELGPTTTTAAVFSVHARSVIRQRSAPSLSRLAQSSNDNRHCNVGTEPTGDPRVLGASQAINSNSKMKPRASFEGLRESVDQMFSLPLTVDSPHNTQTHARQLSLSSSSGLRGLRRALSLGSSSSTTSGRLLSRKGSLLGSLMQREGQDLRTGSRVRSNSRPGAPLGLGLGMEIDDRDEHENEHGPRAGEANYPDSVHHHQQHHHPHRPLLLSFLGDGDKQGEGARGTLTSTTSTTNTNTPRPAQEQTSTDHPLPLPLPLPLPHPSSPSPAPQITHHHDGEDSNPYPHRYARRHHQSSLVDHAHAHAHHHGHDPRHYSSARPTPSGPSSPTTEKSEDDYDNNDDLDADIDDLFTHHRPLTRSFPLVLTHPSPHFHSRHTVLADDTIHPIRTDRSSTPASPRSLQRDNSRSNRQRVIVASRRLFPLSFSSSPPPITAQPPESPTLPAFCHPDVPEIFYPSSPELSFSPAASVPNSPSPPLLSTPCTPELEKDPSSQHAAHQPTSSLSSTAASILSDSAAAAATATATLSASSTPPKLTSAPAVDGDVSVQGILLPPIIFSVDSRKQEDVIASFSAHTPPTASPLVTSGSHPSTPGTTEGFVVVASPSQPPFKDGLSETKSPEGPNQRATEGKQAAALGPVTSSMSADVGGKVLCSDDIDSIDPEPPQPQSIIPSSHPFHHHKPRPSVPFSPRSSTRPDSLAVSDIVQLNTNPSAHRYSKFSAFTSSSHSSGNSSNESNNAYGYPSRPVATVPEEESESASAELEPSPEIHLGLFPVRQTTSISKDNHGFAPGDYRPPSSVYPPPTVTSASSTLVNGSTRSRRAGTISSEHSIRSNRSNKSTHPFAAPTLLSSPTAPASLSAKNGFLSPQHKREDTGSTGFASFRSHPNLAELYAMTTAAVPAHQVSLVSAEDEDADGETCPVCCESLSFTFRLPGEKPHIVPECGHALHEECFVTVYGEVPPEGSRRNLGVCGMCRQPMRIGGGGERRGASKNKLAALMGQAGQAPAPLRSPVTGVKGGFNLGSPNGSEGPADDPLQGSLGTSNSNSSRSLASDSQVKVVIPTIAIHSEFPSIRRSQNGKQVVTAMISVTVPQATDRSKYPARSPGAADLNVSTSGDGSITSPQFPPSPRSASSYPEPSIFPSSARSITTPGSATSPTGTPSSFSHIVTDLRNRVVDYKSCGLDTLGPLRLFDLLSVRKGPLVREFNVYLFQEALICLAEEKKSGGLRSIFSSASSTRTSESGAASGRGAVLKLKGRIYVRHMRKVFDSSIPGELSLTITMEDENMESFILVFRDRASHDMWRNNLQRLVDDMREPGVMAHATQSANKIAKLTGTAPTSVPIVRPPPVGRSATSPASNGKCNDLSIQSLTSPTSSKGQAMVTSTSSLFSATPSERGAAVDLVSQSPLAPRHTPLDLVLVLSLPAPTSASSLPLKIRLIRSSVQFVLACMGPRDRISLVATELGANGVIRKTPLLNATNPDSRAKLEAFVNELGTGKKEDDEFEVAIGKDERQDVVTAVNTALDVVLQRKAKNPLTGMILISDTSDVIRRAQMDLVTARLDAANIPVHSLGYGKSHDPSPLWMISNHTHGTYTFVKEWYHLRDTLAGVVGGLMSIALTNMKLHVSCQDHEVRVVKVSGTSQAIVAATGKDVDIELRELRHGERREILIDLELEGDGNRLSVDGSTESGMTQDRSSMPPPRSSSLQKSPSLRDQHGLNGSMRGIGMAMESLTTQDPDTLRDVVYGDSLIDEVPVADVDCSFHDPSAGRSVARLAHPVLLTLPILPPTAPPSSASAEPAIVRRRMELLASDMITRALLIASRKNFGQATKMLRETKRIIESVADSMRSGISVASSGSSMSSVAARSRREVQTLLAVEGLAATVQDVDMLLDGLEVNKDMFERDHRNYAAQQAIILRSQKSWTVRTPTEMEYATKDVQSMVQLSSEYSART